MPLAGAFLTVHTPRYCTLEAAPPRKGVNVEIDAVAWVP